MRHFAAVLLLTSCALVGASSAHGASLVYIDRDNDVAVARPDGSGAKKVTHAVDADHGFRAVSVADDGGITAFLIQRDGSGNSSFVVLGQDGSVLKGPLLFERYGICGGLSPFRTATTPDGSFVAVQYWKGSSNCLGGSTTPSTRLVARNDVTTGTDTYPSYDYLNEPHWLRHPDTRLAGINGGTLSVWQNDGAHMDPWLALPGGSPYELDGFDFHPSETKLLLDLSATATTGSKPHRLELYSYSELSTGGAAPTDPAPQFICGVDGYVTNDAGGGRPSWSPDGTQIAWRGPDGIYVSPAPAATGQTCVLQPTLVVPGGTDPHWAPFDVTSPTGVTPPAGTPLVGDPSGQTPFTTSYAPWFHATGAWSVDAAANGTAVAVIYQLTSGGPYALGLFGAAGVGAPLTGASCDMPAVGNVDRVSISQDGASIAWEDDRGLLVAPLPPPGGGNPCPLSSAPVVISPTGSYPSLGPTTLATSTGTSVRPPGTTTTPTSSPPPTTPSTVSSKPTVTLAKTVKASAFAKGLKLVVTVKRKGTVTVVAAVGKTTLAKKVVKAARAGKVTLTLKASRKLTRRLSRYRGKTLTLTVKAPGGSVKITRKLT